MAKRITMSDVARRAKVTRATVSYILNGHWEKYCISPGTRDRVLKIVQECNYKPNAIARALASKQTHTIGFILADDVAGGWLNSYFAAQMAGVEETCRNRGYSLNVSLYNLSNLEKFVFPDKVGQQSVDGVILAGSSVEAEVAKRFHTFGIPTICLGQSTELANMMPTVDYDSIKGLFESVAYLYRNGHRRMLICLDGKRRSREVFQKVQVRVKETPELSDCHIDVFMSPTGHTDFCAGDPMAEHLLAYSRDARPTALVGADQTLVTALRTLQKHGISCPADVSAISFSDTMLCEVTSPPLSGVGVDLHVLGQTAANLLLDHLEGKTDLAENKNYVTLPCRIVERDSVRSLDK